MYHALFGAISGSAFLFFQGVKLSIFSNILMLIGLWGLNTLPKTTKGFYIFGLAFHTISLFWVGHALIFAKYTIGIDLSYLAPFVSFGIAFILALQFPLSLKLGSPKLWIIPFVLIDLARSYSETFFPWNFIGYTSTLWLSSLRFVGVIGLTTFMLILGQFNSFSKKIQIGLLIVSSLLTIDHYLYQKTPIVFGTTRIKIVQTSALQNARELSLYQALSLSQKGGSADIIVWPESTVTGFLFPELATAIGQALPEKSMLILGHVSHTPHLHVSMSVLNHQGKILSTYHKQKLVPFGEFIPFTLNLPKLTKGHCPYQPGCTSSPVQTNPLGIPLICYETAFPHLINAYPQCSWIVSISNDGWYGDSAGPYQHFHLARCLAITARKPVVRSVNLGISGLIGPQGQIIATIPFQQKGFLDVRLPTTPYS